MKANKLTNKWIKEHRIYPPKQLWLEGLELVGEWEGSLILQEHQGALICITKKYLKLLVK